MFSFFRQKCITDKKYTYLYIYDATTKNYKILTLSPPFVLINFSRMSRPI